MVSQEEKSGLSTETVLKCMDELPSYTRYAIYKFSCSNLDFLNRDNNEFFG